jgi:hypothetical protein
MKPLSFPLLTLLIFASLLIPGAPLLAAARTAPDPAEPASPTTSSLVAYPARLVRNLPPSSDCIMRRSGV